MTSLVNVCLYFSHNYLIILCLSYISGCRKMWRPSDNKQNARQRWPRRFQGISMFLLWSFVLVRHQYILWPQGRQSQWSLSKKAITKLLRAICRYFFTSSSLIVQKRENMILHILNGHYFLLIFSNSSYSSVMKLSSRVSKKKPK